MAAHLVDNKFIIKQSEKHRAAGRLKLVKQQVEQTARRPLRSRLRLPSKKRTPRGRSVAKQFEAFVFYSRHWRPPRGLVTAVALILATNNFTAFSDSRKFASYCGPGRRAVAPFEHTSGTSIRGRTKTSHLANKRIARRTVKALLSNGATVARPPQPFSQMKS